MLPDDSRAHDRWSLRSLLAWPLGSAAIALVEVSQHAPHQSPSALRWFMAGCVGFVVGLWLGLGWTLMVRLLRRGRAASKRALLGPRALTGLVAACLVTPLVYMAADSVLEVTRANPVDFDATALRLWRAGLLLAVPPFVLIFYGSLRWVEPRIAARPRRALACVALTWLFVLAHMCSGPFFVYFGTPASWLLWAVTTAIIAPWIPRWIPRGSTHPRDAAALWIAVAITTAIGLSGLRDDATRALLLHDNKVFPPLHAVAVAAFDRDADGALAEFVGGNDCDDGDDTRSGRHVENPSTTTDENCHEWLRASSPAPISSTAPPRRPPIFLITIDTVRADHLELYGASRATMPALTAFAEGGRWFERAYAPANHTFFAMTALLSGQSCERMLIPTAAKPTGTLGYTFWLPHRLHELGYKNIAFRPPLVVSGKLQAKDLKFDSIDFGTDDFGQKHRGTTSKQVVDSVITFLRENQEPNPLFAWVHFMDPHAVHESHTRFPGDAVEDHYDNELSWVDFNLARLLREIEVQYGDDALVIITADHGEALGEHQNYGHGFTLREPEIKVPLIVRGPGIEPGVERRPVSTLGVVATVLDVLGDTPPPDRLSYPSLLRDTLPAPVIHNPEYLWNEPRMESAIIVGPWKLIHSRMSNTSLLFNLADDPAESTNLIGAGIPDAPSLDDLKAALEAFR